MKVVIAPDSFKGSLPAVSVAAAIAHGWRSQRPHDEIVQIPLADGGEGSIDTLHRVRGGTIINTRAQNPIGDEIDTQWLLLDDGTAIIEMAKISGIQTFSPPQPMRAHTFGLGQLIREADNHPATKRISICLGGSGTNDAGMGACAALGAHFFDAQNASVFPTPENLHTITRVTPPPALRNPIKTLSDVTNPLFGPTGSAFTYAHQKGATDSEITEIDNAHRHLATIIGGNPDAPGAGAAGGCGYGFATLLGAAITPGATTMIGQSGLADEITTADLLITGEGRFDAQSLNGKLLSHLMAIAASQKLPIAAIVGQYNPCDHSLTTIKALTEIAPSLDDALANPTQYLIQAGNELALDFQSR